MGWSAFARNGELTHGRPARHTRCRAMSVLARARLAPSGSLARSCSTSGRSRARSVRRARRPQWLRRACGIRVDRGFRGQHARRGSSKSEHARLGARSLRPELLLVRVLRQVDRASGAFAGAAPSVAEAGLRAPRPPWVLSPARSTRILGERARSARGRGRSVRSCCSFAFYVRSIARAERSPGRQPARLVERRSRGRALGIFSRWRAMPGRSRVRSVGRAVHGGRLPVRAFGICCSFAFDVRSIAPAERSPARLVELGRELAPAGGSSRGCSWTLPPECCGRSRWHRFARWTVSRAPLSGTAS